VPDLSRSVALQEDKFILFQQALEHMLMRYHKALASLTDAEVIHLATSRGNYKQKKFFLCNF